jgi:hypothetical protein
LKAASDQSVFSKESAASPSPLLKSNSSMEVTRIVVNAKIPRIFMGEGVKQNINLLIKDKEGAAGKCIYNSYGKYKLLESEKYKLVIHTGNINFIGGWKINKRLRFNSTV